MRLKIDVNIHPSAEIVVHSQYKKTELSGGGE